MLRVAVVIGTRPEAIKMAPVIKELERRKEQIRPIIVVTSQHREMLDQVLRTFGISPHHDLDLMQPGQSLSSLTARLIGALDPLFGEERPDWVLVQGDTTTVMAASLVAFYRRIKLGHVEAGLRSGDTLQPFPEEVNRRITDMVSQLYFAPTEQSRAALLREGVAPERVRVTGNTVIDALLMTAAKVRGRPLPARIGDLSGRRMALVTAHRRENFGEPFAQICAAVREIAERYRDELTIVYPVHRNPNVLGPANTALSDLPNVILTDPVDYETMVALLQRADFVLTDSGGLQEEAPSLNKPVLILRDVTERGEVVELGAARLVGTCRERIVRETVRLMEDPVAYARMADAPNPYGDGRASAAIVDAILSAEE